MKKIAAISVLSLLTGLVVLVEREIRAFGRILADAVNGR